MDENAPGTHTSAPVATDDSLQSLWHGAPAGVETGGLLAGALEALDHIADESAESCDDSLTEPERLFREALESAIRSYGGERAFLLRMERDEDPAGADGEVPTLPVTCLAAIDVDGEDIHQPEKKVPAGVAGAAARERAPIARSPQDEGAGDAVASYSLTFPLEAGGEVHGALVVENRFRALALDPEALLATRVQCRVLAAVLELRALRAENRSLWTDVARLREERPQPTGMTMPAVPRSRRSKSPKRSDLKGDYSMIVGSSPRLVEIFQILDRISTSNAPVLINGESGTGKELVAGAIHRNSPRRDKAFVSENCGALTETLLESELFGYMKGAFTGATKDRKGLFELASGGTLFLDEVGDMSPSMQKKLLRVLQEKVIRRVGGKDTIEVDVRIISATNKDLQEEVRTGEFREDLFYRLNVINLKLPPLRERKEDVADLALHFLEVLGQESGQRKGIADAALERLTQHEWPGNIRELQNEVRRLFALSDGEIQVEDLSDTVLHQGEERRGLGSLGDDLAELTLRDAVERIEEHMIRNALVECRGNKSLVAKRLQVPKTSLYNKIHKYGLSKV